jgi:GT2 family glycosyltransferase
VSKQKKITYAILTFNRKEQVMRAIESVYNQKGIEDYKTEIILADAASRDNTVGEVSEKYPEIKVIRFPYNIGCPSGRNFIYANATGEFIINIDDDGYLDGNAVKIIIDTFNTDEKIGVVAIKQMFIGEEGNGIALSSKREDVGLFNGGVSAFRTSALREVGYFPDDYFMFGEESYLSLKFLDHGYRIVSEPDSVMWHPKIGTSYKKKKFEYCKFKNGMLTVLRLYPQRYLWTHLLRRLVSDFRWSILHCSFLQYLQAVLTIFFMMPKTLMNRRACKNETIKKFLLLNRIKK